MSGPDAAAPTPEAPDPQADALAALKARQGAGARWDAENAPAADLLLARRGTAYFARLFNDLPDAGLAQPSARTGATRARIVAELGLEARRLAALAEAARTGAPVEGAEPVTEARLALAETLPPRAMRSLFAHSTVHLNVEWRDLEDAHWDVGLALPEGDVLARDLPLLRARSIWAASLALGAGGRAADVPAELRGEIAGA